MTFFNGKPKAWIESTGQCSSNGAILLIYYSQSEAENVVASKVYNKIGPLTLFPESLGEIFSNSMKDYFKTGYKLNEKYGLSA